MRDNPLEDWQRLTELYREMGEVELYELQDGIDDLTEVAQQVLRDEMRARGLTARPAEPTIPKPDWNEEADKPDEADRDPLHEFTWKVLLTECADSQQAWQIREALRQAGIESWIEGHGFRVAIDESNPRIQVAADQIEEARLILSQPIPQTIVDQSKQPVEEFEAPRCPHCGAEDPVLEGVDPTHSWLCEGCGAEWSDPVLDEKP